MQFNARRFFSNRCRLYTYLERCNLKQIEIYDHISIQNYLPGNSKLVALMQSEEKIRFTIKAKRFADSEIKL